MKHRDVSRDVKNHGPDWAEIYAGRPRWDIGRPQPAFLALVAIDETTLDSRSDPDGIPAWLVALTRT
jgi:hypothetical protein